MWKGSLLQIFQDIVRIFVSKNVPHLCRPPQTVLQDIALTREENYKEDDPFERIDTSRPEIGIVVQIFREASRKKLGGWRMNRVSGE